jgi:hypothetical protein
MDRRLLITGLLALGITGCRSFGQGGLRRNEGPRPSESAGFAVSSLIREHNENATRVDGLKATDLRVTVQTYSVNGRQRRLLFTGGTEGYLLAERPKNFRMVLRKTAMGNVADLGSNSGQFWFSNNQTREVVVGDPVDAGSSPLAASIQPDWIFEVMGLATIDPGARVEQQDSSTVRLSERRQVGGQSLVKETVLDARTGLVREHRLYTAGRKQLLASAVVHENYQRIALGTEGSADGGVVLLPKTIELKIPDMAELTVNLDGVEVNPASFASSAFEFPAQETRDFAQLDVRDVLGGSGEIARAGYEPEAELPPTSMGTGTSAGTSEFAPVVPAPASETGMVLPSPATQRRQSWGRRPGELPIEALPR